MTRSLGLHDREGSDDRSSREGRETSPAPGAEQAGLEEALSDDTGGCFFFTLLPALPPNTEPVRQSDHSSNA